MEENGLLLHKNFKVVQKILLKIDFTVLFNQKLNAITILNFLMKIILIKKINKYCIKNIVLKNNISNVGAKGVNIEDIKIYFHL